MDTPSSLTPPPHPRPIPPLPKRRLAVTEHIKFRFKDKQNILATFSCDDCVKEWQCGEALRRSEPYTSKVVSTRQDGKLELDVGAIRQRQQQVGSLYVPPGPHHVETERPGIGTLKKALRTMDPSSKLSSTVNDLRSLDTRLGLIDTLPRVLYGTARSASAGVLAGTTGLAGTGAGAGTGRLEDYGSPELSKTQRRFASTMRSVDRLAKSMYKGRWVAVARMLTREQACAGCGCVMSWCGESLVAEGDGEDGWLLVRRDGSMSS